MSTIREEKTVGRRQFVLGAGMAMAALGVAGNATASGHEHAHQGHGSYTPPAAPVQALIEGAFDCQQTGQACIEHCVQLLKGGDTAMAECLDLAQEMLAICGAMAQLASYNSAHLRKVVAVCIDICTDCERECRKHEKTHATCRACADACAECIKRAKAFLG